jgi:hypothetical protein
MERLRIWGTQLLGVLRDTLDGLLTYLPVALTAAGVLLVGWLLARLARALVRRGMTSMDRLFGRVLPRTPGRSHAAVGGTSRALSSVVYWTVLLIFAATALRILGGELLERWTAELLAYLPSAIGGILIILIAIVGGTLVRNVIEQASSGLGLAQAALLARLAQISVVLSGLVIGIDQLGVNVDFLVLLSTVIAAAVFGGIALVFAFGTRQHLANLISAHYARKHYAPGDHIRVGAFEGRVLDIADGCVFIETDVGDVSVPAQQFSREPFVKLRNAP